MRVVDEKHGEYFSRLDRMRGEGFSITFWRWAASQAFDWKSDNRLKGKEMQPWEKKNLAKAGMHAGMFGLWAMAFWGLSYIKWGDDEKPLTEFGPIKAMSYAYKSLLVLPIMYEMMTEPMAGMSILSRGFFGPYGDFDLANMRNLVPFKNLGSYGNDVWEMSTGEELF